jgi:antitoxin (DNA-binding transcriptional repressor) of toxin-antitoxin stability system
VEEFEVATGAGEEVIITRRSHPLERMRAAIPQRKPLHLKELAAFRATMPSLRLSSAELLREARDEEL